MSYVKYELPEAEYAAVKEAAAKAIASDLGWERAEVDRMFSDEKTWAGFDVGSALRHEWRAAANAALESVGFVGLVENCANALNALAELTTAVEDSQHTGPDEAKLPISVALQRAREVL